MSDLARTLAELSAKEIADALRVRGRRSRAVVEAVARVPSRRLGDTLARFDGRIADVGIARAARETLAALGARVAVEGEMARSGAALVVTNHPGAYDALAVMAALGRDDVRFIAAERTFLRALPNVSRHLVFVDERSAMARAAGIRSAIAWLDRGGVVVQYGAGAIEPDARFDDGEPLGPWREGTAMLAARAPNVVPVFVSGVHSPRAKRLAVVRWAERRGVTTIAPLVQATLPGFRDVEVTVKIGAPHHLTETSLIREAVARLHEKPSRSRPTSAESARMTPRASRDPHGAPSSA